MQLYDEIKALENEKRFHPGSKATVERIDALRVLADDYGTDCRGPYCVVATAFHGGGILSRHKSAARAADAVRRVQHTDCACGCAGIVPADRVDGLKPAADAAPSCLAR